MENEKLRGYLNLLDGMRDRMLNASSTDEVQKLYRHGRTWSRYNFIYVDTRGTYEMHAYMNRKIKSYKEEALNGFRKT